MFQYLISNQNFHKALHRGVCTCDSCPTEEDKLWFMGVIGAFEIVAFDLNLNHYIRSKKIVALCLTTEVKKLPFLTMPFVFRKDKSSYGQLLGQ